ncbi:unnamed protein product [Prorocentrum cordatum]|uniref:Uncharacterized protein n=1 Tax=Prorocentrum cordatum TaxID=2364126 RepID=A0ABN9TE80_9DINO|nr:unnamed protein product [Polarella glacialis]
MVGGAATLRTAKDASLHGSPRPRPRCARRAEKVAPWAGPVPFGHCGLPRGNREKEREREKASARQEKEEGGEEEEVNYFWERQSAHPTVMLHNQGETALKRRLVAQER